MIDGTCEDCPDYTRGHDNGKACEPEGCHDREKLLIDGTCETCPDYERVTDKEGRVCGSDKCSSVEVLNYKGVCERCDDYYRPDDKGRNCINKCGDLEKISIFGQCSKCPEYSRPINENKSECGGDSCTDTQIMLSDGTCGNCLPYTKSAKYGTKTYTLKREALPIRKHTYSKGKWNPGFCEGDICAKST